MILKLSTDILMTIFYIRPLLNISGYKINKDSYNPSFLAILEGIAFLLTMIQVVLYRT